jgi:uncharacterized membrane protein
MVEYIDRRREKANSRELLRDAQIRPKAFFALYLGLVVLLDLAASLAYGEQGAESIFSHPLALFVTILSSLLSLILGVGCYLYCFGIRRGERMEFLTLFDGFSFVGKVILLYIVEYFFVLMWTLLLIVPGIIASYRYRYAILNLCENPSMGILEAINMSKRQTYGYKGQLFMLDLSYVGWSLLAGLGTLYFNFSVQMGVFGYTLPLSGLAFWAQTLICDVFMVAFSLFYVPTFMTTELGYFEIAKRSSGTGFGAEPPADTPDLPDSGSSF